MLLRDTLPLALLAVAATASAQTARPRPAAPAAGLPLGEYACYGAGMTVLAGLGFKLLPGGRYNDLDGKSPGAYVIVGDTIVFRGGHLAGQTGRDIKGKGFRIGKMATCEKW